MTSAARHINCSLETLLRSNQSNKYEGFKVKIKNNIQ